MIHAPTQSKYAEPGYQLPVTVPVLEPSPSTTGLVLPGSPHLAGGLTGWKSSPESPWQPGQTFQPPGTNYLFASLVQVRVTAPLSQNTVHRAGSGVAGDLVARVH